MREAKDITILIVDDEAALRNAIIFDFKRKGFQVLDAANGKEAFEIVKKNKVDVVLTDIRMPGGDGIGLLDDIKSLDPNLPVVMFITGYADITLEEAYDKGVDVVFTKPFDRKALMASVLRSVTARDEAWAGRETERLEVDFKITLEFPEINMAVEGRALNLGRGGIFVMLKDHFPAVNAKVLFRIQFERGSPKILEGSGVVRWIRTQNSENRPTGCGIEFQSLSESSRRDVIKVINDKKTKAFIPRT